MISGPELNMPGEDGADNEHLSRPYRIGSHQHYAKAVPYLPRLACNHICKVGERNHLPSNERVSVLTGDVTLTCVHSDSNDIMCQWPSGRPQCTVDV